MNGTATVAHAALSSAIFLVEDEPVLRSSLARGLSRLTNVEVLTAGTFDEAVLFLGTRVPSLLISDIDLPGASGLDLVAEFSRREIDVPIIATRSRPGPTCSFSKSQFRSRIFERESSNC
jgi:DNA-binding response OmpR family regulator